LQLDKKSTILRAAEELVKGRRFHEVTMEGIARAAHVSKGTIYTYFRDKDELFFQLATDGFEELCELLGKPEGSDLPFRQRLLDVCRQISSFFEQRKPLMRVMIDQEGRTAGFHREMRGRLKEGRLRMVRAVSAVIERGVTERQVRSDLSASALAEMLLGMLRSRGRRLHDEGEELLSIENVVEVFLNGAGSTRGS
jgi:AcrR family transcriptional regulator